MKIDRKKAGAKKRDGVRSKDFGVELKSVGAKGKFTGYVSVFGNIDAYREIVAPGAFADSLKELKAEGRTLPILWNHNSNEPIGYFSSLVEDEKGLKVEGVLLVGEVRRAKEVAALVSSGAISGMSIGYWEIEDQLDQGTGVRTLTKLKLREGSLVTFPANEDARVETIKMKLAGGTLPTIRELEKLLRDAGFSKSVAAQITAKGYTGLQGRRDADVGQTAVSTALNDVIARFKV